MVTRIKPIATLTDALRYNEEKVAHHHAEVIDAGGFLGHRTYDQKHRRLQDQNDLNTRAKFKTLHATINFHPDENLSNEQLSHIARRYIDGLGLAQNPYLVYSHHDQGHPHLHIVASLIRSDGTRVSTHHLAERKSEPTRKAIEQEFHLRPNDTPRQTPQDGPIKKVDPARPVPLVDQVHAVTAHATTKYTFASLEEYNAILRPYNLTAETGRPGSKTHRHQGLYYTALDDTGKKIAPPIMSSDIPDKPTLHRLQQKFLDAPAARREYLPSLRQRINDTLDTESAGLAQFAHGLWRQGIDLVIPPEGQQDSPIFVDHHTHTAITGQDLGPGFNSRGILTALSDHSPQTTQHIPTQDFNPRVPQLLTTMLDAGDDNPAQQQRQTHRPKL